MDRHETLRACNWHQVSSYFLYEKYNNRIATILLRSFQSTVIDSEDEYLQIVYFPTHPLVFDFKKLLKHKNVADSQEIVQLLARGLRNLEGKGNETERLNSGKEAWDELEKSPIDEVWDYLIALGRLQCST